MIPKRGIQKTAARRAAVRRREDYRAPSAAEQPTRAVDVVAPFNPDEFEGADRPADDRGSDVELIAPPADGF